VTVTWEEALAIAFINLWSALSIYRQLCPRRPRWLSVVDVFCLVPSWRFFAPKPTGSDLHLRLSYRKKGQTVLQADITPYYPKSILCALWNPARRLRKSITSLARIMRSAPVSSRRQQSAERMLAAFAVSQPISVYGRRRRFDLISRSFNGIDVLEELIFQSDEYVYGVRS
jgi:hypothetical protein